MLDTQVFLKLIFECDDQKWQKDGFPAHPSELVFHHAMQRDFVSLYSVATLLELLQKFQDYEMDLEAAEEVIRLLRTVAEEVSPPVPVQRYCSDAKDDKFIHCAIHGHCSHLVTFDKGVYRAVTAGNQYSFLCRRPVPFLRELKDAAHRHKASLSPFGGGLGLAKVPSEVDLRRAARTTPDPASQGGDEPDRARGAHEPSASREAPTVEEPS